MTEQELRRAIAEAFDRYMNNPMDAPNNPELWQDFTKARQALIDAGFEPR